MSNKRIRIGIEEDGFIYKVTSIYLANDGSFKVDVPYCKYDRGILVKLEANYDSDLQRTELIQEFSVKNRPQLSIHSSGFIQFSARGIVSGIDKMNGEVKGMGFKSNPLDQPIWTGPTFGIQIWGLKESYEIVSNPAECDMIYHEKDFIIRPIDSDNNKEKMYIIEGWIFPHAHKLLKPILWEMNGREKITLSFPNYTFCPNAVFSPDIIRLKNHNSFIGILPFTSQTQLAKKSSYGFILNCPTEPTDSKPPKRHIRMAISRDVWNSTKDIPSLDYQS